MYWSGSDEPYQLVSISAYFHFRLAINFACCRKRLYLQPFNLCNKPGQPDEFTYLCKWRRCFDCELHGNVHVIQTLSYGIEMRYTLDQIYLNWCQWRSAEMEHSSKPQENAKVHKKPTSMLCSKAQINWNDNRAMWFSEFPGRTMQLIFIFKSSPNGYVPCIKLNDGGLSSWQNKNKGEEERTMEKNGSYMVLGNIGTVHCEGVKAIRQILPVEF